MADERSPRLMLLDDSEEVFELPEGRTRIGRAPGNEMRLEDKTVSRFHCQLVRSGREVRVEDAESHNSTRVNGQHAEETRLHDGDVLRVGRLKLRYCDSRNDSRNDPEGVVKRTRYAARKRGPALFPLLFFLVAVLGLSWLFIASSFTGRRSPDDQSRHARSRNEHRHIHSLHELPATCCVSCEAAAPGREKTARATRPILRYRINKGVLRLGRSEKTLFDDARTERAARIWSGPHSTPHRQSDIRLGSSISFMCRR